MAVTYTEVAMLSKALGDENRLRILFILKDGEQCGCKLLEQLNISQPTLSHHIKILCEAKMINARKDGKWIFYSLRKEGLEIFEEIVEWYKSANIVAIDDSKA